MTSYNNLFSESIDELISSFKNGSYGIIVDDFSKDKGRGFLFQPAAYTNTNHIHKMSKISGGITYLALEWPIYKQIVSVIPELAVSSSSDNTNPKVGINFKDSTLHGISATDKFKTIEQMLSGDLKTEQFQTNGQVYPLGANFGGVLAAGSFVEVTVDIAKLLSGKGACIVFDLLNDDGMPANSHEISRISKQFGIPSLKLSELVVNRRATFEKNRVLSKGFISTPIGKKKSQILLDHTGREILLVQGQAGLNNAKTVNFIVQESDVLQEMVIASEKSSATKDVLPSYGKIEALNAFENSLLLIYPSSLKRYSLTDDGKPSSDEGDTTRLSDQALLAVGNVCTYLNINHANVYSFKPVDSHSSCGFSVNVNEILPLDLKTLKPMRPKSIVKEPVKASSVDSSVSASGVGDSSLPKPVHPDVPKMKLDQFSDEPRLPGASKRISVTEFSWHNLVSKVFNDNKDAIDVHRLRVVFLDGDKDAMVKGDFEAIREIVTHLLDNVIRYTPKKEGSVGIEIKEEGSFGVLGVYDNGIGMSSSELNTLKDNIKASAEDDVDEDNLLLGFKISNKLISKMNGKLEIESELGTGSQIFISLPLA